MLHAILLWLGLWFGAALSIGLAWVLMAEYAYWLGGRRLRRVERSRINREWQYNRKQRLGASPQRWGGDDA